MTHILSFSPHRHYKYVLDWYTETLSFSNTYLVFVPLSHDNYLARWPIAHSLQFGKPQNVKVTKVINAVILPLLNHPYSVFLGNLLSGIFFFWCTITWCSSYFPYRIFFLDNFWGKFSWQSVKRIPRREIPRNRQRTDECSVVQ